VTTAAFSGAYAGSDLVGMSTDFEFVGPTAVVTVDTDTQRLTGAATMDALMTVAPGSAILVYGLCYQDVGFGPVSPFTGSPNFHQLGFDVSQWVSVTDASSVQPGSGTYEVGFCVRRAFLPGSSVRPAILSGWVQVTN
jgi:hypothetical protein